ncbi:uncharacterized protein LOC112557748 [Pomacea canaliculata]|uniref:uncharacterized protein LOC112557748 n=1 Tax=Pomacea canaliculata TaxID=400727 RepID=UPI000D72DE6A|nr:uncharacterized protein LOC112557748 [Pomacea canaliculata]
MPSMMLSFYPSVLLMLFKIMATDTRSSSECQRKNTDSCPSGHELMRCPSDGGYRCQQCGGFSFQPNENWLGDRCRLRRVCDNPHMDYKDHGSTTKDADCQCQDGFHFENEDQRACVPNRECGKGYGQGDYGVCVKCIDLQMYSDSVDRKEKCKPLTKCKTKTVVVFILSALLFASSHVKSCDEPQKPTSEDSADPRLWIIGGGIAGSIILIIIIIFIIYIIRRNSYRRRKFAQKPLSPDQLEELKHRILKACEKENTLCKKVMSKSVFIVEERIDRQIWTLAQELYRSHPIQGKYELVVEKYKESQHKYAVNGYLQEWKLWKGESKESIGDLFKCLSQCKRDDIVYEVCNALRNDVGMELDLEAQLDVNEAYSKGKQNQLDEFVSVMCPCGREADSKPRPKVKEVAMEKEKGGEASDKLLEAPPRDSDAIEAPPGAGDVLCSSRPTPTAPVIDDSTSGVAFADGSGVPGVHIQYSQPMQAHRKAGVT